MRTYRGPILVIQLSPHSLKQQKEHLVALFRMYAFVMQGCRAAEAFSGDLYSVTSQQEMHCNICHPVRSCQAGFMIDYSSRMSIDSGGLCVCAHF